ncbi:hypothetical protein [Neoaquamicrobium sediminum]|uniref:hypothetical protein n=1 Tax=Neoaquamicrobium sediminum TaxID=1849104 RepID=UPI0040359B19
MAGVHQVPQAKRAVSQVQQAWLQMGAQLVLLLVLRVWLLEVLQLVLLALLLLMLLILQLVLLALLLLVLIMLLLVLLALLQLVLLV